MFDLVGAERAGEIAWRDRLVGAVADPGIRGIAQAFLLQLVEQVAEPATQHAAGSAAREQSAQSTLEHVAKATARRGGGDVAGCRRGGGGRLRGCAGLLVGEMLDRFP